MGSVVPVPRLVPVPPVPVHQVTVLLVPATPFAVKVVVDELQIGLVPAVAEVIATSVFAPTVTVISTALPQSPVALA